MSDDNYQKILFSLNNSEYSDTIILDFSKEKDILKDFSFKLIKNHNSQEENTTCFSKNNMQLPDIEITVSNTENEIPTLTISVKYSNILKHHLDFLADQLKIIDVLIRDSESGFLEFAHYRKSQILQILYYVKQNESDESNNYKRMILEEFEILKINSKRMKNMYEDLISLLN